MKSLCILEPVSLICGWRPIRIPPTTAHFHSSFQSLPTRTTKSVLAETQDGAALAQIGRIADPLASGEVFWYDALMLLSVDVPDSLARQLHRDAPALNRRALELLALEGYRDGELSRGQVSEALGIGFQETEEFLKRHNAQLGLTVADYERSGAALEKLLAL